MSAPREKWNLDRGHVITLVRGPHPYLWIGASDENGGEFYDTLDERQIRSLRDALTKALRHAL